MEKVSNAQQLVKKNYTVHNHLEIGSYEYGYVRHKDDQFFFAIADGWKVVCGAGFKWAVVKRLKENG